MDEKDEFWLSEDMSNWLGLKKSEYLSKLIENQSAQDYVFEEFPRYDRFIPETIEHPDSVFDKEEDDHRIRSYVRTYEEDLHQVVVGAVIEDNKSGNEVFIPIISFITKFHELALVFAQGTSSGPLRS